MSRIAEDRASRLAGASEVPTEPISSPSPTGTLPVSAIENEIPTYRAISPMAVVALICGIVALLSFAHPAFLLSALAAIVLGIQADRKIRRLSDILTGRELAQAGIALGLVFGLASITTTAVQDWILAREAAKFARIYEKVLSTGSMEEAMWFTQAPRVRTGRTPQDLYAEMRKAMGNSPTMDQTGDKITKIKSEIADEGAKLEFSKIEQHGKENLGVYAAALYEMHHPKGKGAHEGEAHDGEEFALVVLKGAVVNRKYEWWVEAIAFPYQPASFKPTVAPVDDGHGHAH